MKTRHLFIIICILFLSALTGCMGTAKNKVYINPNVNFRFIKKVAVLPFENLTNDRFADKKVRDIFVTALLASEFVDVPELGDVLQVLNTIGMAQEQPGFNSQPSKAPTAISKETARVLGQGLGVQGIILGSVEEYNIIRSTSGSFPEVSVTLRMIDPKTGAIIWAVSHSEQGGRILPSILGVGEATLTETAIKAAKNIVDTLIY